MSKKEALIAIYQLNWRDNTFYLNLNCYVKYMYLTEK